MSGQSDVPGAAVPTLIVDDEAVARTGLREMLAGFSWIRVVGEAASGPAAVEAIDILKPELVFLDVRMPGLSGIDVLGRVRHQPFVVFTTAWGQHAVTAFELGALDYLLKPFGADRLGVTMERVRAALGSPVVHPAAARLREATSPGPLQRLFVRSAATVTPVPVERVSWFEARGDYVAAHAGSTRHLLQVSLSHLERRLDPARFVRIHRSRIVNLDRVAAFRPEGRGLVAELEDGTRLAVSRARAQELRRLAR